MKRMSYLRVVAAAFAALYLQSCALDEYFESRVEQYTKAFIKEFGLVDPEQDWTMGQNTNAEINVGVTARSVKIYGKYGDTYYKVADLSNVGGQLSVPVHVPKTCTEMMVRVDGNTYYGKFGSSLNCTGISGRGVPNGDPYDTYDRNTNPNILEYKHPSGYQVNVKHTDTGNDPTDKSYQRFNTQQMAPIVSRDVWNTYYSLNTGELTVNTKNATGILPESGIFNADRTYLDNVLANANALSDVAVDFNVEAGDNGTFTLFPYYYGTNLIHELGVYLLDDKGEPLKNGGDYIKLPIFVDKDHGDMQIQPHYCKDIAAIRVFHPNNSDSIHYDNPLYLNVGDIHQLDVRLFDAEGNEIKYDEAFMKKYHSRIAFHAWVEDEVKSDGGPVRPKRFGKKFVTCDEFGTITAHIDTHDGYENMDDAKYYMTASIAVGLNENMAIKGVAHAFPIIITDPTKEPETEKSYGVDIPAGVSTTAGITEITENIIVVCIDNKNISEFTGISDLWGADFTGVAEDESGAYYHCLYERDASGLKHNLTETSDNVILADGKIALLFEDIKASLDTHEYAIVNQYDENKASYSYADYELVGLKFNGGHEWWSQCYLYLQPRGQKSASIKSRAEIPADDKEMLTDNGEWRDVHRAWTRYLPYGKEVASYPVDMPMLARTRGYDVTITNADGTPYTGKFGMYMTVAKENKMKIETVDYKDYETKMETFDLAKPYTLYSQQKLNEFGQRTAAAFNHPKSGRTFFTFEDMNLTHKAADEGGYAYAQTEKSSDRDVNDLIFLLKGYEKIEGTKNITPKEEVKEDGFNWIWALEDLGSTGDFDFNDVVMRISDITVTKTTENAGGVEGNTTIEIARELRFKPLAAGGTLPVHIHLNYNNKDFTLAPGTYDITKGETPEGMEWHKWFGAGISSSQMLNTGISGHITTSDANTCVLIVDKDKTIFDLLQSGDGEKNSGKLYVVVQGDGDETWREMQAVDQDRMSSEDAYLIPRPEKGKAAQSFFILDNGGGTWQWMKEYNHICLGYPDFAKWINDPSLEWTSKKNSEYIYKTK